MTTWTGRIRIALTPDRDDKGVEVLIAFRSRCICGVSVSGWSRSLEVTAGGRSIVSQAGLVLLRQLADKTGLTRRLSRASMCQRITWSEDMRGAMKPFVGPW